MNTANTPTNASTVITTIDPQRGYSLTKAALNEAYEEHVRRTRAENPETAFTHYFNSTKQAELFQHRRAFGQYLKSLGDQSEEIQKDAITGIVRAWDNTLPNQLTNIVSQLSDIVNQKWYGSRHEAYLMGVTEEIAYCAMLHKDESAMRLLDSALSPYIRIGFGTEILHYVSRKGYQDAAKDKQRKLQFLPAAATLRA